MSCTILGASLGVEDTHLHLIQAMFRTTNPTSRHFWIQTVLYCSLNRDDCTVSISIRFSTPSLPIRYYYVTDHVASIVSSLVAGVNNGVLSVKKDGYER